MAVSMETTTKCTYKATMGRIEMWEEGNSVQVDISGYRTTKPELLREFAALLNDVATKMEAGGSLG